MRIHYDDIVSDIEKEQGNIRMLWIIREAIAHKRIVPYFQEIHSNIPGKPRLFEALMRIKDEEGNLYFPDSFLPLSKEYSLYDVLSVQMVDMVMSMFADKTSRVTINLNVQDIYNRNMLKMIFDNMEKAKRPQNFVFEIVETEEVTDYIKIDGAVIKEILNDSLVCDFVEFMQSWCKKNKQALICEYIENKEIQDIMETYGVAYSQGYYFSKPHPWGPEDE